MAEEKKQGLTMDELLAAPIDSLTTEQLSRRSQIIVLLEQERRLELTNIENQKFQDQKDAKQKQLKDRMENIAREYAENQRIRKMCKHNTGGKDRPGFFQGDGDIYGRCVSKQMLPTGEIYGLCFRCQKEWHDPKWWAELADGSVVFDGRKAVMEKKMTLAAFARQEREFREMMGWTCKTFEGNAGELPGGAMFFIPKLQHQFQKSAQEFEAFLGKMNPNELAMAGYQPAA